MITYKNALNICFMVSMGYFIVSCGEQKQSLRSSSNEIKLAANLNYLGQGFSLLSDSVTLVGGEGYADRGPGYSGPTIEYQPCSAAHALSADREAWTLSLRLPLACADQFSVLKLVSIKVEVDSESGDIDLGGTVQVGGKWLTFGYSDETGYTLSILTGGEESIERRLAMGNLSAAITVNEKNLCGEIEVSRDETALTDTIIVALNAQSDATVTSSWSIESDALTALVGGDQNALRPTGDGSYDAVLRWDLDISSGSHNAILNIVANEINCQIRYRLVVSGGEEVPSPSQTPDPL